MDEQGLTDAAIFLMSLGEQEASEVFKHFSPKEVQKLGEAIARMRNVSRDKVDQVIMRFSDDASAQSLLVADTSSYVRSVLRRALGEDRRVATTDRGGHPGQGPACADHAFAEPHLFDAEFLALVGRNDGATRDAARRNIPVLKRWLWRAP